MTGISIIIPTLNRTDFLVKTLDDLFLQAFDHPFEIIIVDQSNQPDQVIISHIAGKEYVKYQHVTQFKGLPEARNYGWQQAKYEYVLYVDDDIECGPYLLSEHFKCLENESIGVVAGGITEKFKQNQECQVGQFVYATATPQRGFHQKGSFEVDHGGGGNFSTKKTVLQKVHGIDENLTKGAALYEETDFCLRVKEAGYKTWYHYEAHVYHLAAATGGCRVEEMDKYLYSLVRNRSLIISRHVKGIAKLTATLFLLKLVLAYTVSYKKVSLLNVYRKARKEGIAAALANVKCTQWKM